MLDFKPPRDNGFVIGLAKLFKSDILRYKMHNAKVVVLGDGLERFKKLKGKRAMVCPNHSHKHDCEVMFLFSCLAGEEFNFIAAREIFDWNNGINGWFLQQLGVYSVVRGAIDRESFKTTKRLLVDGKKKLVLFPEGEISRQNDVLLPLENGASQLSFMALDELHKKQPEEPLYIVPVAIKYTYDDDLTGHLAELLNRIEKKLGIDNHSEASLYKRVRAAAEVVLATLEGEYNVKPPEGSDLNTRMNTLKSKILETVAEFLDITLPASGSHLDWVRVCRNAMDDIIYAEDADNLPPYQRKIHAEKSDKIRIFYRDLDRVVTFIAIYDGYLSPPATQERMVSVLELIESEIFGDVHIKGPRTVYMKVGEPIDLLEVYSDYKKTKKAIVEKVSGNINGQLAEMLQSMDKDRKPVFVT